MRYVKIPKERIPILIGTKGEIKDKIQKKSGILLNIDSEEGSIDLKRTEDADPINILKVRDVVRAIGRGFNPRTAMGIIDRDLGFECMDIKDYVGNRSNRIRQIKGRVIGKGGKTRRLIENLAECKISVYGHTVSIVGELLNLSIAKSAVDMLLSGSKHASVYQYLERKRQDLKAPYVMVEDGDLC